jgi:hypothetical protein
VKKNKKDKDSLGPKTIMMMIVGLRNKGFRAAHMLIISLQKNSKKLLISLSHYKSKE